MKAKIKILGIAVLCFVAGFVLHRLLTFQEVNRLEYRKRPVNPYPPLGGGVAGWLRADVHVDAGRLVMR